LLSASQLSVASPSQQGLPDSQRSGHGRFRHIFSQEERDKAGASAPVTTKVMEGNGLLAIPPQSLMGSNTLVLPPGSPGAPLFMMNESSNHSQLSLGRYGDEEGDYNYQYNDVNSNLDSNDNNSTSNNRQIKSRTLSSSSSSGKRDLDRKLSFLSSSQANEIEESGVDATGTFKFSSGL